MYCGLKYISPKECYIRFLAPVNGFSTEALLKVIDSKVTDNYHKIHLLINSPGGSVSHGIAVYNILRSLTIECDTYNIGSVDSIGAVIFCGGTKRFAMPNSRFLIHPIQWHVQVPHSMDEHNMRERLKSVQIDQNNIISVISQTTDKPVTEIEKKMHERTVLNAEQAQRYQLVTSITEVPFIPNGAEIIPIYESSANPPPKYFQLPGGVKVVANENYTSMFDLGVGQTRMY